MGNMQQMFSQMGIPGLGKHSKVNMSALENQLNRNMKKAIIKERIKAKTGMKATEQSSINVINNQNSQKLTDEEIYKIFSTGEKVDKTPRGSNPQKSGKKKGTNKSS